MKKFLGKFKSIRKDILFIFIFTIIVVIVFNIFETEFKKYAGSFSGFILNMCYSYIASFVFYFLVIHLQQENDKDKLYPYIIKNAEHIIGCSLGLIHDICRGSNIDIKSKYPTDEDLDSICKSINFNARSPFLVNQFALNLTWLENFEYYKSRSDHAINNIMQLNKFLDADFIIYLIKIDNCQLFKGINNYKRCNINNQNITFVKDDLIEYFKIIRILENYIDIELKKYR